MISTFTFLYIYKTVLRLAPFSDFTTWRTYISSLGLDARVIVFNATFNNISVISLWSILLVEETGENRWSATSHWQTLSHNVVSITPHLNGIQTHNFSDDSHWYYTITTTKPPYISCAHGVVDNEPKIQS